MSWGPLRAPGALAAALVLVGSGFAAGQQLEHIRRGDIHITVPVHGTVITQNIVTMTSSIPGEIEDVNVHSTATWVIDKAPLATVASERLAALLDSPTTTDRSVVLSRWKSDFPLIPIYCPSDCYLLSINAQAQQEIAPKDVLFTAAQTLRMAGVVAPEYARYIHDGQWLTFWVKGQPDRKYLTHIDDYVLDNPGQPELSAGTFGMDMSPAQYFPPGTAWEGTIVAEDHPHALLVPTASLIEFQGQTFLPIPISTGITNADWTEIAAGVQENEPYLLLNTAQLQSAVRYQLSQSTATPQATPETPNQNSPSNEPDYGGDIYIQ